METTKQAIEVIIVSTEWTETAFITFEDSSVELIENSMYDSIQDEIEASIAGSEWSHRTLFGDEVTVIIFKKNNV